MSCRATQDGRVMVESTDKMQSTGEGNGKPLQYSCFENPMSSMKYPNQIDYILCSQRGRSSKQTAKTRLGADCGSDHELLIAKFRLKLKKVGKTTRPFSSVQFSRSVMSDSLRPHEPQHTRPLCPSPTPRVHPNSCPLSR